MITFVTTADIRQGKEAEAFQFAVKLSSYVIENFSTIKDLQVLRNLSGQTNQVHWVGVYESLADVEEINKWMAEDAGFREKTASSSELFIEGSFVDRFYAQVS